MRHATSVAFAFNPKLGEPAPTENHFYRSAYHTANQSVPKRYDFSYLLIEKTISL